MYCIVQVDVDESTLSAEEQKERKIMKLLLKIKNGTPPMRKVSNIRITTYRRSCFSVTVICILFLQPPQV